MKSPLAKGHRPSVGALWAQAAPSLFSREKTVLVRADIVYQIFRRPRLWRLAARRLFMPGDLAGKIVALSFDNGVDAKETPRVLRITDKYGMKTVFSVIGKTLKEMGNDAITREEDAQGHIRVHHTDSHNRKKLLGEGSAGYVHREVFQHGKWRIVRPHAGGNSNTPKLLGPFFIRSAMKKRISVYLWNALARDWLKENRRTWRKEAFERIKEQKRTGLVLHDISSSRSMRHLEGFVLEAMLRGVTFVPYLDELMAIKDGRLNPRWAGNMGVRKLKHIAWIPKNMRLPQLGINRPKPQAGRLKTSASSKRRRPKLHKPIPRGGYGGPR